MTGLQTAFYIIGIIYAGVSLLLILGLVIAIFAIRNKIVSLENMVKEKLSTATALASKATAVVGAAKKMAKRKGH